MESAARDVVEVQIPALRELCQTGTLSIDNVDVFCEKGVFDRETSARVLRAGIEAGWRGNFHGDELHPMEAGCVRHMHTHIHTHMNTTDKSIFIKIC